MTIYSRSSIRNATNWRFWIRKKKNTLINFIKYQDSVNLIGKIDLCTKGSSEPKNQFLIKKSEDVEIKHSTDCMFLLTYAFQRESTLYICRNVKELLARGRCQI